MKNILAVDTSTPVLYVSLQTNDKVYSKILNDNTKHSISLITFIDNVLKEANLKINDIDLFACCKGPGSFTGLRIALSCLKGFNTALNTRYVSIPSLDVFAFPFNKEKSVVIPVIDASKNRIYCTSFVNGERTNDYLDLSRESFGDFITGFDSFFLCGPYSSTLAKEFNCEYREDISHSDILLTMASSYYKDHGCDLVGEGPLYVRESDAQIALLEKSKIKVKSSAKDPIYM